MSFVEVKPLLSGIVANLHRRGVPDATVSVARIAEHVLQLAHAGDGSRRRMPATATEAEAEQIAHLSSRRINHEPLQYIIGEWDFHNLHGIKCAPPCLIPRPETEELVELALASVAADSNALAPSSVGGGSDVLLQRKRFLEVGVGTGAISIAMLRALAELEATRACRRTPAAMWTGLGIDTAAAAVRLCSHNATAFEVAGRLEVVHCSAADLCQPSTALPHAVRRAVAETAAQGATDDAAAAAVTSGSGHGDGGGGFTGGFDLLISNPPYIPSQHMSASTMQPEVFHWEDHRALDGGPDGLDVVRDILAAACQVYTVRRVVTGSDSAPAAPHGQRDSMRCRQAPAAPVAAGVDRAGAKGPPQYVPLLKRGAHIWLEVDGSNAHEVQRVVAAHPVWSTNIGVEAVHEDFAGVPRFVHARRL